jgi:hypothetical protein
MIIYSKEQKLEDALMSFNPKNGGLDSQFMELAKYFLYGGYIHIQSEINGKKIERLLYIREVEFYFYDETEKNKCSSKVYHRNGKYTNIPQNERLPIGKYTHYFIPGTIYPHASGIDITFENKDEKYRASALIRAFSIIEDGREELIYLKNNKSVSVDPRSTYVYEYLFEGFSIFSNTHYSIEWVDNWNMAPDTLIKKERINFDDKDNEAPKKWRFIWTKYRSEENP